jgi:protease-4
MTWIQKLFWPITAPIVFIQNHFKAVLLVLVVIVVIWPSDTTHQRQNNLQEISLNGPIFDAKESVDAINEAATNDEIKGVLFVINSPGGAVAPSLEIAYAIKRLSEKKPVVVYGSGLLASGGYYAAIWANEIMANPGAIVGSIGVILEGADISGLLSKVGIKTQTIAAGEYKQIGTIERQWTPQERKELTKMIDSTYAMFVSDVAQARNLPITKSDQFADGRIFTADEAKTIGLVDGIGVEYDAKKRVETLSEVAHPVWNKEDRLERFIRSLGVQSSAMLSSLFPALSLR